MDIENFESTNEQPSDVVEQDSEQEQPGSSIPDLDSLERFTWNGKELTSKELNNLVMLQSDYTRKTQEVAEERKYAENFLADAQSVLTNPQLKEKFFEIYPERYRSALNSFLERFGEKRVESNTQQQPTLDRATAERIERLEQINFENEVKANEAQIDSVMNEMAQKFKLANADVVLTRAQSVLDKGEELTPQTWEKLYKQSHAETEKLLKTHYGEQFKRQKAASEKAKDIGSGGSTPGEAPKKMRLDEVTKMLMGQG